MDNLAPKEIADEEMINQAFHELLNDYLNTKHRKKVEIITKAFNFANQAHKGIKRRSGEPYICLLYTSPSPRDVEESRMPSSA